jgi:SAM-dependent methyltransferase
MNESLHERETEFHDEWARSTNLDAINVREAFESPTAMENRFILKSMGDLKGKRILDIGSGLGESSVYFALLGASVTTVDISPVMVETAVRLGEKHGVKLEGIVSTAEGLSVPRDHYDFVYIANAIHHVPDRPALFRQIHDALRPGGKFFSIDPVGYNPVINVYRRMATEVRTPDEEPLRMGDLALVKQYFREVGHREFWLSSLVLFLKYYLVDRVHPNEDRYWKRIFRETPGSLWWWLPFQALDSILCRLPLLRWWSWNIVMWGSK